MFMPQSSSFEFQQHNHLQVKHEPPRVFDLFFLLLAPDSYCRLEAISPPASNCLSAHLTADWSDAACCQSLRQSLRCHITCFFFFFFFPLLLRADLVLYTCLTAAKRILCAFAENASPAQNGAPMDHGALRTARVRRVGRGGERGENRKKRFQ